MTFATVSSNYLSTALLPAVRQAQSQLADLQVESATGQYADLGLQLGAQSGYELSLRTQDDLLQAMTAANGVTATNMSTAQAALTSILSSAQSLQQTLTNSASGGNPATLQTLGQGNLQQFIALANTSDANGYVFAGQNSQQTPLDDYLSQPPSAAKSAIDAAFQSYFGFSVTSPQAANITASQMQGFLAGPFAAQFASPAWGSNWTTASNSNTTAEISPGNTIQSSVNTNSAGFQQLAEGYAMLTEFGGIGLGAGAQQTLISAAAGAIGQGVSSVISTQAQLGQAQSQLTDANNAMANQMTLLQKAVSGMDSVDPAQVATQLTMLSTQLQTAYQITAQLHNLNLAQYLPA